jgi:hypothetical protein
MTIDNVVEKSLSSDYKTIPKNYGLNNKPELNYLMSIIDKTYEFLEKLVMNYNQQVNQPYGEIVEKPSYQPKMAYK